MLICNLYRIVFLVHAAQGVCPELEDPEFGEVSYCETDVGDTACYCCCDDYELVGDEERTCQSDGSWSGDEPVCRCESSTNIHMIIYIIS